MCQDNRVSFFEDKSKNEEFKNRLMKVLSKKDNKILNCTLEYSVSNVIKLFIKFKDETYDFKVESFDFYYPLHRNADIGRREESCYNDFRNKGLNKEEVDELFDILDDFTFKNFYEGQFFASKFFDFQSESKISKLIFKYTPNEKDDEYEINGSYFKKKTGIVSEDDLKSLFEINKEPLNMMKPINAWRLIEDFNIEKDKELISKRQDYYKTNFYVIEYYKNLEKIESFVYKVYEYKENDLKETNKFD